MSGCGRTYPRPRRYSGAMTLSGPQRERFLQTLADTCNLGKACEASGMSRTAWFKYRKENPEFDAAWKEAERIGVTVLEDEAKRRAFEGVEKPILYQGQFTRKFETRLDELTGAPEIDTATGQVKYFPVYDRSGRHTIETIREYSDSLVALLLKAHDHDKYRDHSKVEVEGNMSIANALIAGRKRTGIKP